MKKIISVAVLMAAFAFISACAVEESMERMEIGSYVDGKERIDTSSVRYKATANLYHMCIHSDWFGAMPYGIAEIAVKELPTIDEMNVVIEWAMCADCFDDTVGETDEFEVWLNLNEC